MVKGIGRGGEGGGAIGIIGCQNLTMYLDQGILLDIYIKFEGSQRTFTLEVLKQKEKRAIMVPLLYPQLLPYEWCTMGVGHISLRRHMIPRCLLLSMINHLVKNHEEKNSGVYGGHILKQNFYLCKRVMDFMKKSEKLACALFVQEEEEEEERGAFPETKHSLALPQVGAYFENAPILLGGCYITRIIKLTYHIPIT